MHDILFAVSIMRLLILVLIFLLKKPSALLLG